MSLLLLPTVRPVASSPNDWFGVNLNFTLVHHAIQIDQYQMYAVEKWIVQRNRPVTVLTVYTGDPSHKITVTAFAPSPSLSPADALVEWEKALHLLRKDGARPKQTPHGVLMATSLAHFRSDYTIVHIPHGNFLAAKDQLYTNINLLRLGCSGRGALTLEEPTDATKLRFISTYHLPEITLSNPLSTDSLPVPPALSPQTSLASSSTNTPPTSYHSTSHSKSASLSALAIGRPNINITAPTPDISPAPTWKGGPPTSPIDPKKSTTRGKTKDRAMFNPTMLELVKLIQAGLAISGIYGMQESPSESVIAPVIVADGLLCDVTVEGIQKWITDIGEPCVGLEPMERIVDPMFVSALLSLVLAVRNKLAALGYTHDVPRDPFLHPHAFTLALTAFSHAAATPPPHAHFPSTSYSAFSPPPLQRYATSPYGSHHPHTLGSPTSTTSAPPFLQPQAQPQPLITATLTRELIDALSTAYDAKIRLADNSSRKVRRVLKGKLDDLTSVVSGTGSGTGVGAGTSDGEHPGLSLSAGEWDSGDAGGGGADTGGGGGGGSGGGVGGGGVAGTTGSSGGQLLSGIASGLGRLSGGGSGSGGGGAETVLEGTVDLTRLLGAALGKEGHHHTSRTGRVRRQQQRRESADLGGRAGEGVVAGSVVALWGGRVADVVRMREREHDVALPPAVPSGHVKGAERERWRRERLGVASDGDLDERERAKSDGRSTEEESEGLVGNSFGGVWSEKMQRKLGSWAALSRRKGNSIDVSTHSLPHKTKGSSPNPSTPTHKQAHSESLKPSVKINTRLDAPGVRSATNRSLPQSPTLPPMVFAGDAERDPDDDDLLSSGQVSPISDYRPNPFKLLYGGPSVESSKTNLTSLHAQELERRFDFLGHKRPWARRMRQMRAPTWADPLSARGMLDEDRVEADAESLDESDARLRKGKGKEKGTMRVGMASVVSFGSSTEDAEEFDEDELEMGSDVDVTSRRRLMAFGPRRRRSFHDLDSLRPMFVLTPERMRIDVELCGQLLIMYRREEHLQNVVACLHVLTSSLSQTNTLLREDYESHLPLLAELEQRTKVLASIDAENLKADKISQATNTLRYESEQFAVSDLWHAASPSRTTVLALRDKIFGTGGRRLPAGVHGAHGRFNRVQWTLGGEKRLVDYLGRTEREAEEESRVDPDKVFTVPPGEDEDDVVEHPGIKPMWLLRFFTSWGARWSAAKEEDGKGAGTVDTSGSKDTRVLPAETEGDVKQDGRTDNVANTPAIST